MLKPHSLSHAAQMLSSNGPFASKQFLDLCKHNILMKKYLFKFLLGQGCRFAKGFLRVSSLSVGLSVSSIGKAYAPNTHRQMKRICFILLVYFRTHTENGI